MFLQITGRYANCYIVKNVIFLRGMIMRDEISEMTSARDSTYYLHCLQYFYDCSAN